MDEDRRRPAQSWGKTAARAALTGLMTNFLVLPIALGFLAGFGLWLWSFLAIPAMVVLCVLISVIARLVEAIRGNRPASGPRPERVAGPGRVIVKRTAAVAGLLVAAAAGIALMAVGVKVASDSPTCDPEVSRCIAVVDGVAQGESHASVGDQQVGNVFAGGIAFLPGLAILIGTYFGAERLTRSISAGRATKQE